jgi:hypothetical protein
MRRLRTGYLLPGKKRNDRSIIGQTRENSMCLILVNHHTDGSGSGTCCLCIRMQIVRQ